MRAIYHDLLRRKKKQTNATTTTTILLLFVVKHHTNHSCIQSHARTHSTTIFQLFYYLHTSSRRHLDNEVAF